MSDWLSFSESDYCPLTGDFPTPHCDLCQARPATWRNRALLGCDTELCVVCFELWWEYGITNAAELRQRSLERQRLEALPPKE